MKVRKTFSEVSSDYWVCKFITPLWQLPFYDNSPYQLNKSPKILPILKNSLNLFMWILFQKTKYPKSLLHFSFLWINENDFIFFPQKTFIGSYLRFQLTVRASADPRIGLTHKSAPDPSAATLESLPLRAPSEVFCCDLSKDGVSERWTSCKGSRGVPLTLLKPE